MIPAGINPGETEFFKSGNGIMAMQSGVKKEIEDLPYKTHEVIDMAMDAKQRKALDHLGITHPLERRIQFLKCNASVYDATPDIVDGKFQNEYVSCPFRQQCPHEGKLCKVLTLSNGEHLTLSELRITSLIRAGLFDKEIARTTGIAETTLRKHKQNIQEKLEVERKTQIATKAIEIGIA